ncbi:hypothetical protein SEA_FIZZLES_95 [Microbacterium phage Fizzles]|nr:hypothetical protein SEA_FIZZLES_95 [Microbacterium phage Fizzles]
MTARVEVGYDVRHWATFEIKDPTPEEIETIDNDDEESIELLRNMERDGRLTFIEDHKEDNPDYFDTETSGIIGVVDES